MYMVFRRRVSALACCLVLLNFMFIVHAVNFEIKHCLNYHATLKNHNRSTALKRSVIDFFLGGGGGGLKHVLLDPNPRPVETF